jgi:hypothetical protein
MRSDQAADHNLVHTCERFAGHLAAVVVGFVMMIVGVAMGVTMVLLPIGIPLGVAGLLLFLWGIYFAGPSKRGAPLDPPGKNE